MSSGSTRTALYLFFDLFADGFGELRRRGGAAEIAGAHAAVAEHRVERLPDAIRPLPLADVLEHQQSGQQQGSRVRHVLIGDVGSAAVHRLEYRRVEAEVRPRDDTQS